MSYLPVLPLVAGTWAMVSALAWAANPTHTWTFEDGPLDAPLQGFTLERTNGGPPGRWIVRAATDAPSGSRVIAQVDTDTTRGRFLLAVASEPSLRNAAVSVKCKPVAGTIDQACGLAVRYQDANNYYVARGNALEGNVRFYRVKDGSREELASWDGSIAAQTWHEIRVEARGNHFVVDWNGTRVIDVTDDTFTGPGRVGLWTKADSVTEFDNLTVMPAGHGP